jgi:glycosyltransferase involved in cell wall biosynthesis
VGTGPDSTSRDNGDITVVISCFNYGRYVEEAVDSALRQEGGAPHVIVVDDGSTDPHTLEVLDRLPSEVEVLRRENGGVSKARNAGLERAQTPYAIVLDADDRLAPAALAALRSPLDADPRLGFTYAPMRFFGDWEGILWMPPYDPYKLLYRHIIGLTCLMRRELIEDTGGFDPEIRHLEDWELWIHALAHGWRGQRVDAVALEYRKHGPSKFDEDRRQYRYWYARIRRKHAALYRDHQRLAEESDLGPLARLWYRLFWGHRPVPARLERALHRFLWRN